MLDCFKICQSVPFYGENQYNSSLQIFKFISQLEEKRKGVVVEM